MIVNQLGKKFPAFYGAQIVITVFKETATGLYTEPAESSLHHQNLFI
jgi:hypothetical protein